jgi:hypothetical protein
MENAAHDERHRALNEEFRRRVKTQGSLPGEDAALLLLYSLVAIGQITLSKLDGHEKIATVIRARVTSAARGDEQRAIHEPGDALSAFPHQAGVRWAN